MAGVPGHYSGGDMEKSKKMIQAYDIFGEDLSEGNPVLEERRRKILENLAKRHERLRVWLAAHGMLREKNKEAK